MHQKKCKILFISTEFPPGPGGIGNHAWNLSKQLNNVISIDLLTISDYVNNEECKEFDRQQKFHIFRFKRTSLRIITVSKRILTIIKYINSNKYSYCILSGRFALWMSNVIKLFSIRDIKLIGVLHGSELLPKNLINKLLLFQSLYLLDKIVSVSRYTDSLISSTIKNRQKNFIIPNGVNIEQFSRLSTNQAGDRLIGSPCFLSVGSISDRKGQINFIKALPLIINQYPKCHFHCVGLIAKENDIIDSVKKMGVNNYITLHGFIANNELSNIYSQTDIFIMLSNNNPKYCAEGFGIAILEANLFGVPAIGSSGTGIEDAIKNGYSGLLVNPHSDIAILQAIDKLIQNKKTYHKQSIEWAKKHDWEKISTKYLEVINNA